MSNVNPVTPDHATVLGMIQASKAAGAAGRRGEADQLLARVAQLAPGHPAVLNELGLSMMQRGEAAKARELFQRATAADPGHPSLWSNLAESLQALGLQQEAIEAVERALALEPRHLASLLQKGALIEARGDPRNAARCYRNALATLPAGVTAPPAVSALLERARQVVRQDDAALAEAIEQRLAVIRERHGSAPQRRVDKCIELLTGRRSRYTPQPTFMYFPEIPAVEFFDRAEFPWLDAIEAASDEIRAELTTVLVADRAGLEPYIAYPEGVPLDQWKELNKSRRWSAYFLWNQGVAQAAHMARCPRTVEALKGAPQCDVRARGPTAFFSILDAATHIPPHTGVTNTRVIVHLPLIVPPDCGFRVGGETREWLPGKAWVFDDTIEHEAWNRSDTPRAVLIFDIWNPFLSEAERDMVRAATEVFGEYYGVNPEAVP
ncbi:MAG TPA: aspartyl/asparaginyl beta-hydroxylase domain-containing protein [Steroidobacteraceae bacterium]|nr:aspartyl/asparaginyl beta-hydroxylase domain-containing protein [Steroidobacteraceae bacterium]